MKISTIGYDKVNQLRHVRFFKDLNGIKDQMRKHADILRPKFELVENVLEEELKGLNLAVWTKPHGGYFISLNTCLPIAASVVDRCKTIGLELTPAGSAFPYHKDPNNSNIRIAPSFPNLDELKMASKILALSIKIESILYLLK